MPKRPAITIADATPLVVESDVAQRRRAQVVNAAVEIIATQGIHRMSLGNIEKRANMTRGHLMYYFPTKEDILLAVLDRMIGRMKLEAMQGDGPKPMTGRAWDCVRHMIDQTLQPPDAGHMAFLSLIHTFHAQVSYRDDVRQRLATLNAEWRAMIAADYAASVPDPPPVPPLVAASIIMALVQGLGGQLAVDPNAHDRKRTIAAISQLLAPIFGVSPSTPTGEQT